MNYKRFPLGALWTNGYLFWDDDTKEAFFVDPGGDTSDVREYITANGLKLTMILLTHGHIDHIAGIHELVPFVGGNIYIGEKDAFMLRNPSGQLQALLGVHCEGLDDFKTVSEGSIIDFPGCTIKVMETPGHTPGSVCLIAGDVLFSGDTLFRHAYGRVDHPGGDLDEEFRSIRRLLRLDKDYLVLSGHGRPTTLFQERELYLK